MKYSLPYQGCILLDRKGSVSAIFCFLSHWHFHCTYLGGNKMVPDLVIIIFATDGTYDIWIDGFMNFTPFAS